IQPDQLYYPAPDLVVEVLSKSTKKADRETKFEDYAAHGVAEYWLVDPTRQTIEPFTLDAETEAYAAQGIFRVGQRVSSSLLPDFTIPVKAVFEAGANVAALRGMLAG
ncbi:MAG: Uma2 family endonuclease, partial [Sphingobacteriaceae bacterium]|nr:Uma2 family endonuclease [Cytophagaceae bacterium]